MKRLLTWCGLVLAAVCAPASAQPAGAAETAIRAALAQWTSDFNARDASRICDLFAKDLRYDYRGFPERDYDALCGLLHKVAGRPDEAVRLFPRHPGDHRVGRSRHRPPDLDA